MNTGASFTDSVVAALSQDAEVLAAMSEPVWDTARNTLLVKIDPKDQANARELGEKAVELIRSVKGEKFKAAIQQLNIDQKLSFVFKLTLEKSTQ